jgi:hypothetical protein
MVRQKKRSHTTPLLPWAMADCAFRRQRKAAYQYQRPSVANTLRRAESDMTARALAYALSVDIVNIFRDCSAVHLLSLKESAFSGLLGKE